MTHRCTRRLSESAAHAPVTSRPSWLAYFGCGLAADTWAAPNLTSSASPTAAERDQR